VGSVRTCAVLPLSSLRSLSRELETGNTRSHEQSCMYTHTHTGVQACLPLHFASALCLCTLRLHFACALCLCTLPVHFASAFCLTLQTSTFTLATLCSVLHDTLLSQHFAASLCCVLTTCCSLPECIHRHPCSLATPPLALPSAMQPPLLLPLLLHPLLLLLLLLLRLLLLVLRLRDLVLLACVPLVLLLAWLR